tara:strand:+ start:1464 stop:2138 length:675 start_codon:yes stop_codon:yes gene_type:complete
MRKQITLKAPKSLKECSPEQMIKWLIISEHIKENTDNLIKMLEFQAQVVSIFCDITFNQAKNCNVDDLTKVATYLFQMLSNYEYQEPSEELNICGIIYEFDKDVGSWTTGQIVDMKLIEDITLEPCKALSIMYVEKGMYYCEEDDRGKVKNPNSKREAIFKEHFPADEFLNFFNFFLHESKRRSLAMSSIKILRMMEMRRQMMGELETLNGTSGQASSTDYHKN